MTTLYQLHHLRWKDCTACDLHLHRRNVVLCRGTIPCDALCIGEAPGQSEDVLGAPFVGPAGKLLDAIISCALRSIDDPRAIHLRIAFTNLIACIPLDGGGKTASPPHSSIMACRGRLRQLLDIASPRLVILVGDEAARHFSSDWKGDLPPRRIIHPAAILRANEAQRPIAIQRAVATLIDAFEDALVPF